MKKSMKKPTVTVALSALNEEQNIIDFLKSVLMQKEDGFTLEHIWVYSDGSTDGTAQAARSLGSPKIEVVVAKQRAGKSSRLNEIYQRLESDILVQSDADVVFAHPRVIHDIIQPLLKNKKIGMCGGHPQPIKATTFTEKAVNLTFEVYAPLRSLNHGSNIYSVDGRILAYRRELVKKIHVPSNMIANDAFTYYTCLMNGYKYKYVPTAVVLFRSPQTFSDQVRQNTRFLAAPIRMTKHFPAELVAQTREVPKFLLIKSMLWQALRHPILTGYIFGVNAYCRLLAKRREKELTAQWPMAYSTKNFKKRMK